MKTLIKVIALTFSVIIISCNDDKEDDIINVPVRKLVITIDKGSYLISQDIAIKVNNNTDTVFTYSSCGGSFNSSSYGVQKKENNEWVYNSGHGPCPDWYSYLFTPKETLIDTIHSNNFEKGEYRLDMLFHNGNSYTMAYSNVFLIE